MNPIYTLEIVSIGTLPEEGSLKKVVKVVDWAYIASTEDIHGERPLDAIPHGSVNGSVKLPSPSPISFTEYNELTEAQVRSWVEAYLSPEQLQELKKVSLARLEDALRPKVTPTAAPWLNTTPVDPA